MSDSCSLARVSCRSSLGSGLFQALPRQTGFHHPLKAGSQGRTDSGSSFLSRTCDLSLSVLGMKDCGVGFSHGNLSDLRLLSRLGKETMPVTGDKGQALCHPQMRTRLAHQAPHAPTLWPCTALGRGRSGFFSHHMHGLQAGPRTPGLLWIPHMSLMAFLICTILFSYAEALLSLDGICEA